MTLTPNHVNVLTQIFIKCHEQTITIKYRDNTGDNVFTILPYYFYFSNEVEEIYLWAELLDGSMRPLRLYGIMEVGKTSESILFDRTKVDKNHFQVDEDYMNKFIRPLAHTV